MIGVLEIAILVLVLLLIFGYRYLPALGRRAGGGAREVREAAHGLGTSARERLGDHADPSALGRRAGEGLREAREFRDALTGKAETGASGPADESEKQKEEEAR